MLIVTFACERVRLILENPVRPKKMLTEFAPGAPIIMSSMVSALMSPAATAVPNKSSVLLDDTVTLDRSVTLPLSGLLALPRNTV